MYKRQLIYGVIEKKLTLDYYIDKVSSVKLRKINTVVLNVLRMGLYQIIFLSTPESAACNSSVELTKTNGQMKSAGFVNAVLRKLSQLYHDIPLPENKTEYLSVKYSVSPSVLKILVDSLGEQNTKRYLEYKADESKTIYIAANTVKLCDDKPVSYTHLDVYKRQVHVKESGFSALLFTEIAFCLRRLTKGLFMLYYIYYYLLGVTTCCLLYTSFPTASTFLSAEDMHRLRYHPLFL